MHELVLRVGEASNRADREFTEFWIEFCFVAKLAAHLAEAAQQVGRMSERLENVADGAAALGGEVVVDDAVGFGEIFAIQVRYAGRHECTSLYDRGGILNRARDRALNKVPHLQSSPLRERGNSVRRTAFRTLRRRAGSSASRLLPSGSRRRSKPGRALRTLLSSSRPGLSLFQFGSRASRTRRPA